MLPEGDRVIGNMFFKCFNVNFRLLKLYKYACIGVGN